MLSNLFFYTFVYFKPCHFYFCFFSMKIKQINKIPHIIMWMLENSSCRTILFWYSFSLNYKKYELWTRPQARY